MFYTTRSYITGYYVLCLLGTKQTGIRAIGLQNDCCVAEYVPHNTETEARSAVYYNPKNGKFQVGVFSNSEATPTVYAINQKNDGGAALLFALMPLALKDNEFAYYYYEFRVRITGNFKCSPELEEAAYILCDNIYRRIGMADQLGETGIYVDKVSDNIPLFTELNYQNEYYSHQRFIKEIL